MPDNSKSPLCFSTVENPPKNIQLLLNKLVALNHDELRILWVFAVIYVPVNQTPVKDILSELEWKSSLGERISPLLSKPLRERLLGFDLLESVSGGYICNRYIVEVLARQIQAAGCYLEIVEAVRMYVPSRPKGMYDFSPNAYDHDVRRLRDALYIGDEALLIEELNPQNHNYIRRHMSYSELLFNVSMSLFDEKWFAGMSQAVQALILDHRITSRNFPLSSPDYIYLMNLWQSDDLHHVGLRKVLLEWRIENLQLSNADSLFNEDGGWHTQLMQAWLLALTGRYQEAMPLFADAQKKVRKELGNKKLYLSGLPGLYYCFCLLQSENVSDKKELEKHIQGISRQFQPNPFNLCFDLLAEVQQVLSGRETLKSSRKLQDVFSMPSIEVNLILVLSWHWLGEKPNSGMIKTLLDNTIQAHSDGKVWFVLQALPLLEHYQVDVKKMSALRDQLAVEYQCGGIDVFSLMSLLEVQAPWMRALQALQKLNSDYSSNLNNASQETRIAWFITGDLEYAELKPKEQKKSVNGIWSKGRNVSLKRLANLVDDANTLPEEDLKICRCIEKTYDYYGSQYSLYSQKALQAAIGHPLLFWDDRPEQPVELLKGDVELIVQEKKQKLYLFLNPVMLTSYEGYDQDWLLQKEGEYRLRFYQLNSQHQQILRILGETGLTVPLSAKKEVLKSIGAIAPLMSIQSDIGGGNLEAKERIADTHLYMQLQPQKSGFSFRLCVQPLGIGGPQFIPGEGRSTVVAEVQGERVHSTRDLNLENKQYKKFLKDLPMFFDSWDEQECEWSFGGGEALDALYLLQDYGEPLVLLWPEGGQLTFHKESALRDMQASVRKSGDWFALEGGLTLDDGQVISMAKLMALMEGSPSRFVKLNDDTFLTLTKKLSQRLQALKRHGEQRFHRLATSALEEMTDGMQVVGDEQWKQQKQVIQEAYQLQPEVPSTLQAELRDYQQEGYAWLARLAHWGAGACLADDMGLGKTVQSLALILSRAAKGPTLILAPTSVCMNWLYEATRFAPTLNPIRFGDSQRQKALDAAGPFDLVVCSYGLLQTEIKKLKEVSWGTIVADEAQALKNPQTKRSQAAVSLKSDFKMITTGTPIENHLGELWSLFRFINPGLLGSLESFNKRFSGPIENDQDKIARQHLKRLVQPFILRRLKTDVLTELPARTEITISVPLSSEETIFYEALRRKAIENLSNNNDKPGQKQLKILAEIMTLRRACCNARLVMAGSEIPSSKLAAFGEIVDELRENKHRALVFSQFVGHLALIQEYLDRRGVSYQYLDGSTSVKKREKAVNDFQNGVGELFLISLKAGGSGLNLTAADYVVHMDPWWNPAVEDQASDRAHRLGQKRPVTIYRLVSENTIEQKIIALHGVKRDLADSLLDGSDVSGKLSADEIMNLISDNHE